MTGNGKDEEEIPLEHQELQYSAHYIRHEVPLHFQQLVSDILLLKGLLAQHYFEEYKQFLIIIGSQLEAIFQTLCDENLYNVNSVDTHKENIEQQLGNIEDAIIRLDPNNKNKSLSKLEEIRTELNRFNTIFNYAKKPSNPPKKHDIQPPLKCTVVKGWMDALINPSYRKNPLLFFPRVEARAKKDFLVFKISTVFVLSGLIQAAAIRIVTEYRPSQTLYTYIAVPCAFAVICAGTVTFGLIKSYRKHQYNRRIIEDVECGVLSHDYTKRSFEGHYAKYNLPFHFQELVSSLLSLRNSVEGDLNFKEYIHAFKAITRILTQILNIILNDAGLENEEDKRKSAIDLQVSNNSTNIQTLITQISTTIENFKSEDPSKRFAIRESIKENVKALTDCFLYAINGHKDPEKYPPPEPIPCTHSPEAMNNDIRKINAAAPELPRLGFIPNIDQYAKNYTQATKVAFLFTLSGLIQAPAMWGMTKLFPTNNIYTYLVVPAVFAAIGITVVFCALGKSYRHEGVLKDREKKSDPRSEFQKIFRDLQKDYPTATDAASANAPLLKRGPNARDKITKLQSYLLDSKSPAYSKPLAEEIRSFFAEKGIPIQYGALSQTPQPADDGAINWRHGGIGSALI